MGYKAFQHEPPGSHVIDVLRQTHTTAQGPIDKGALSLGVRQSLVIQRFDKDTQGPHQQSGDDEDQRDLLGRERHKPVKPFNRQLFHAPHTDQHQHQTHQVAIGHTHQIDKRREAHKS